VGREAENGAELGGTGIDPGFAIVMVLARTFSGQNANLGRFRVLPEVILSE
jgi:hypothetical protein